MSRRPSAPEVWEQALINANRKFPSLNKEALAWAEDWYLSQGQRFIEDPSSALEAPESIPAEEETKEAEKAAPEAPEAEPACPMPTPTSQDHEALADGEPVAEKPAPEAPKRRSSRVHRDKSPE